MGRKCPWLNDVQKERSCQQRQALWRRKERGQQLGGLVCEAMDRDNSGKVYQTRQRARVECVLDWYLWEGHLTPCEYEAGMKFRRAYLRAVLGVKVDDPASSGVYDPEMAMLIVPISQELLTAAYEVMSDAQQRIVINVCGHEKYAGTTDRIQTLHRGLERLATLWKL